MKERLTKYAKEYKIEVGKAVATAVVAAFGFLMALSWREVIKELVDLISGYNSIQNNFLSAVIVTGISVIGIMIVTQVLKKEEKKI